MADDPQTTDADLIAALEERLACVERLVLPQQPMHPSGCTCPPGAEATCQGVLCPRKLWRVTCATRSK